MRSIILFLSLLLSCLLAHVASGSERPNVLFIACDDLRNDLGCYGHPLVKTPNFDRLADRSVVFDRAYCQQALCNPSRASLMTGHRPDTLRIWNLTKHYRDDPTPRVTLPQHFKANGYFTQGIGKLFHNWQDVEKSDPASWSVPEQMHIASHYDDTPKAAEPLPANLAKHHKCERRDVPDDAYFDGRIARMGVEALQACQRRNEPFFLALGFWKPHSPFNAPKKYWDLYDRDAVTPPEPGDWPEDAPRIAWHNSREILGNKGEPIDAAAISEIRHGYLANISYLDAQLGLVLDELDRLKLTESTIVVLWSDHGYHLGEQTLWAKTSNFELDARVPLLIAAPGMTIGTHTSALAELLDIYPTLVELCDLPSPDGLEGVSLVPVLRDTEHSVRNAALTQHPRPAYYRGHPEAMGYSVRTDDFRYTEWRDWSSGKTVARELYDHTTDPYETCNLAGNAQYSDELINGAGALDSFRPLVKEGWSAMMPRPAAE